MTMTASTASLQASKRKSIKLTGSPPVRLLKQIGRSLFKGHRYGKVKRMLKQVNCSTGAVRCLPDFLVIGAQKSGSSSLFYYLQQHSQVMLPLAVTKEVHYFDEHYERKSLSWYRGHFPISAVRAAACLLRGKNIITGEATPEYLVHPRAPERIAKHLPNVKCIAVLRNPIDRAWSSYNMEVKRTAEKRSFEEAVRFELEHGPLDLEAQSDTSLAAWNSGLQVAYLTRGVYSVQLERWLSHFPPDQLLILLAEDLFERTEATYQRISEFLGIDRIRNLDLSNINEGAYEKNIPPAIRMKMQQFFEPHNARLAELIGRPLPWN